MPQVTLPWSVASIASDIRGEQYEGVVWTLSETLLDRLGGRVMGSWVVSIIPAWRQKPDERLFQNEGMISEGTIRGRAIVYRDGERVPEASSPDAALELRIKPHELKRPIRGRHPRASRRRVVDEKVAACWGRDRVVLAVAQGSLVRSLAGQEKPRAR